MGQPVTKNALRTYLLHLTKEAVVKAKAVGLTMHFLRVPAGSVLLVPAGWVILQQSVTEEVVGGFRQTFMPTASLSVVAAEKELAIDLALSTKDDEKAWPQILLDILAAERATSAC